MIRLVGEHEELSDLLEDLLMRIQEIREEITAELGDPEYTIVETRERDRFKFCVNSKTECKID